MNGPDIGANKKRSFMPAELAHRMSCKKDFLKVKFNPRTKREFFIMSSSTIYFYTLKEAF